MGAVTGLNAGQAGGGAVVGTTLMGPAGGIMGGGMGATGALGNLGGGSNPVGTMLGVNGGAGGTGFAKPQMAGIQSPVTPEQIAAGQAGAGNSLASQQALVAALQGHTGNLNHSWAQGQDLYGQLQGLSGATSISNANAGMGQLANQLGGAGGIGAQTGGIRGLQDVLAQQQGLAGQYGDIAAGRGPNPAQAMLNQRTGENVANQSAMMAGQRGAGANVGLMARQAAQQGSATQQQAVGQGATMQANQQMAALGQMGAQQQAMAGTNQAIAGIGQGLTGAQMAAMQNLYGQGAGTVGLQQAQFGQNAGIAQQQVGNAMGAQNAFTQNNIANSGQMMGAQTAFNSAQTSGQGSVNAGNAGLAQTGMQGQQSLIGGIMNKAGVPLATMAAGGEAPAPAGGPPAQSAFGQFLQSYGQAPAVPDGSPKGPARLKYPQSSTPGMPSGTGTDMTPGGFAGPDAASSPAGGAGFADSAAMVAAGGGEADMRSGGPVAAAPGQQAVKAGDSYANDKIPAVLSEKEIVLPRSVTLAPDAPAAAAKFVAALQAKKGKGRKMMAEAGDPELAPEAPAASVGAEPALPTDGAPTDGAPEAPSPPPPGGGPLAGEIAVKGTAPMRIPRMVAPTGADLVGEAKAQMQDVANGVIKPMTYKDETDRLAEHNTLGKVGVIAGMLLSGAGAGLTHSDSALLNMMDKEIQRDYDAKVKTNENFRNQFKLGLEAQTANANNALTNAQVQQTQHETKGQQLINANTTTALMTNVRMMQKLGMTKEAILRTQAGNPAALQALEQAWQMKVQPYFEQKAVQNLEKAGAANQMIKAVHEDKTQPAGGKPAAKSALSADNPVDDKKIRALVDDYQWMHRPGQPSVPGIGADEGSGDKLMTEAADIKQLYKTKIDVNKAWEDLDKSALAGETDVGLRDVVLTDLAPILAILAGSGSAVERDNVIKNLPAAKDLPSVREKKAQFIHGLFERAMALKGKTIRSYEARPGVGKIVAELPPPPHVAKGKEAAPEQRAARVAEDAVRGVVKGAAKAVGMEQIDAPKKPRKKVGGVWYERGPKGEAIPVK